MRSEDEAVPTRSHVTTFRPERQYSMYPTSQLHLIIPEVFEIFLFYFDHLVSVCVRVIAIGAGGLTFDSQASKIGYRVVTAATFLLSCVAQTLSHGDRPHHLLHASVYNTASIKKSL